MKNNSSKQSEERAFDRRRHTRVAVGMPCHLSDGKAACICTVRDISVSGVAVESPVELQHGAPVDLLLKVSQGGRNSHVFCSGSVSRVMQADDARFVYGIRVGLNDQYNKHVRMLDRFLAESPNAAMTGMV